MSCRVSVAILFALIVCPCVPAGGALLSQRSVSINRDRNIFTTSNFTLEVEFGNTLFFNTNPIDVVFDNLAITPASVGQTFQATLASDAKFDEAAVRLTDALNQAIRFVMTETSSGRPEKRGYAENQVLNRPVIAPDFAGKSITALELKIDGFALDFSPTPPPMPVNLQFTFSVFGVPEPGSAALALGALAMLAGRRYSRRS
jgi:MYXO-CTERM domain-containing protein